MFTLDLRTVPDDETLLIEGELAGDIFGLGADDPAAPEGPLRYRAEASVVSGELLVRGRFEQVFRFVCGRCLEPFPLAVVLEDHSLLVPVGDRAVIDLTEPLREDILLALPSFPRCDAALPDGSPSPRECSASGEFSSDSGFRPLDPEQGEGGESGGWEALDQLQIDSP